MIGGMMLLCAVAAMVVLANWSLARDDAPDARPRDGLLALRDWPAREMTRSEARKAKRSSRRPDGRRSRAPKPVQAKTPPKPDFDPDDMAAIAEEAERTLPDFVKAARESY